MRELTRLLWALDIGCGLLALLFVGLNVWDVCTFTRADQARLEMSNICEAVELVQKKHHAEPIDLRVLVETGVLDRLPKDPWGYDYFLETSSRGPAMWTFGSDGAPGGSGSASDLRYECMTGLVLRSGER